MGRSAAQLSTGEEESARWWRLGRDWDRDRDRRRNARVLLLGLLRLRFLLRDVGFELYTAPIARFGLYF